LFYDTQQKTNYINNNFATIGLLNVTNKTQTNYFNNNFATITSLNQLSNQVNTISSLIPSFATNSYVKNDFVSISSYVY